ncbi:MAG: serine hydrolase, partial [Actinomycetes bacterium]
AAAPDPWSPPTSRRASCLGGARMLRGGSVHHAQGRDRHHDGPGPHRRRQEPRGDAARPFEVVNLLAAGGLYSAPADMSRLGAMLMNGGVYKGTRILSADAVAQMAADETLGSFNPVPCTALRYGLGWDTVTQPAYGTQVVDPIGDHLGAMFLQIPDGCSRDLEDAVVAQHGAEGWIEWGGTLYRPMDSAPALAAGPNTVTFGADGYAEWRVLPSAANVQIGAGAAWRLYDADMVVLAAGASFPATAVTPTPSCYLLLFGEAGSSAAVTVTPPSGASSRAAEKSAAGRERRAALWPEHAPRLR